MVSNQYYINSLIPAKDVSSGNLSNGMEVRSPMQNKIVLYRTINYSVTDTRICS